MEAVERNFLSDNWITFVFLFGISLLFFMKLYQPKRLIGYFMAFFTQGFVKEHLEEKESFFTAFKVPLFLFLITSISLTIHFVLVAYGIEKSFFNLLIILGSVILYFLFHFIVNLGLSKIFKIEDAVRYFIYTKFDYFCSVSLLIFPFLIIYQYSFTNRIFLLFSISLLILFRFFLILINNKNLIFNHLFYFILYFCTLELAPLLIFYKTTIT